MESTDTRERQSTSDVASRRPQWTGSMAADGRRHMCARRLRGSVRIVPSLFATFDGLRPCHCRQSISAERLCSAT